MKNTIEELRRILFNFDDDKVSTEEVIDDLANLLDQLCEVGQFVEVTHADVIDPIVDVLLCITNGQFMIARFRTAHRGVCFDGEDAVAVKEYVRAGFTSKPSLKSSFQRLNCFKSGNSGDGSRSDRPAGLILRLEDRYDVVVGGDLWSCRKAFP